MKKRPEVLGVPVAMIFESGRIRSVKYGDTLIGGGGKGFVMNASFLGVFG